MRYRPENTVINFTLQDVIQSLPAVRLRIKYVSCTSMYRHYNCAGTLSNMTKNVLVVPGFTGSHVLYAVIFSGLTQNMYVPNCKVILLFFAENSICTPMCDLVDHWKGMRPFMITWMS
jgi:hypothetical protein